MFLLRKTPLSIFLFVGLLCLLGTSCNEEKLFSEFIDVRDGKEYKVMRVGGVLWFAEDLNLNDNNLYSYQQALAACPEGWSLAGKEDWIELVKYFGGYRYDGEDIGDPTTAFRRMISEFGAQEQNYYWSSTPAWEDVPSIRSSQFHLSPHHKVVEYGATLISFQMRCRCVNRPLAPEKDDLIQFTINDELQTFGFYRIDWNRNADRIEVFLHRKLDNLERVNRVDFHFKLPSTFVLEGDTPVLASVARFEHQSNSDIDWTWVAHSATYPENLEVTITYYDGSVVKGEFSGIGYDSVPIENGTFVLKVNK